MFQTPNNKYPIIYKPQIYFITSLLLLVYPLIPALSI